MTNKSKAIIIEIIASKIIELMMSNLKMKADDAISILLSSKTYELLSDFESGLFHLPNDEIYQMLENELDNKFSIPEVY